jgi:DNA-binding LacI/PurR family transcriptional regulator
VSQQLAKEQLVSRRDITAIVTANSIAAEGLFAALDEANIPSQVRPAILCFDDVQSVGKSVVSYLRLPWDEVGRMAAQVLWERKTGQLSGPPQQRLVQMRLIPRLTCHPKRANSALTRSQSVHESVNPSRTHKILEPIGT